MLTDEQRAARAATIGASECAAALGASRWKSPHDVWRRLVHGEEQVVEGEAVDRGNFLEEGCVKWYAKKMGIEVAYAPERVTHPRLPFLSCLPDGLAATNGVEVKNPGPFSEGWGKEGTSEVPPEAYLQAVQSMACTGLHRWDVVAPMGGRLLIFPILRDEKLERHVLHKLEEFWKEHVEKKVEPPFTFLDDDILQRRFPVPKSDDYLLAGELSPGAQETLDLYLQALLDEREWRKTKEACANNLKAYVGERTGIDLGERGRIHWKVRKGAASTNWEAVAAELWRGLRKLQPECEPLMAYALRHIEHAEDARVWNPRIKGDPSMRPWRKTL